MKTIRTSQAAIRIIERSRKEEPVGGPESAVDLTAGDEGIGLGSVFKKFV
jgi:hypothetical protein